MDDVEAVHSDQLGGGISNSRGSSRIHVGEATLRIGGEDYVVRTLHQDAVPLLPFLEIGRGFDALELMSDPLRNQLGEVDLTFSERFFPRARVREAQRADRSASQYYRHSYVRLQPE